MLTCAVDDEPSMEGILAEVRRLLLREDEARGAPAEDHEPGEALLLTDMIGADGSVVRIAPDTKAAAVPPARDPFAKFDALRNQVTALLGTEPATRRPGRYGAAKRRRAEAEAPAVSAAMLCHGLIDADGGHSPAGRAISLRAPDRLPARAGAADRAAAHADHPRNDPGAEIERMLAHQMAAAHRVAMMLTDAAVEQIRDEAGGKEERPAGARAGVRVLGKRRRGDAAARLADSAVRMMQAYNATLATLMTLGGEAARSVASRRMPLPETGGAAPAKPSRRRLSAGPPRGKHAARRRRAPARLLGCEGD